MGSRYLDMNFPAFTVLLFSFCLSQVLNSQNLVPNYSFEGVENLPIKPNPKNSYEFEPMSGYIPFLKNIQYWYKGTQTTPDLRITTSANYYDCQQRYRDCDRARTGNHMVGIITSLSNTYTDTYREYIQIKLGKTLRPGIPVHAELWAIKERSAKLLSNNLGFYFSQREFYEDTEEVVLKSPQINWDSIINQDTFAWVKVSGTFTPDKPLRYLTIGNFFNNENTKVIPYPDYTASPYTPPYAYYLIDDVRVWQDGDEPNSLEFDKQLVKEETPIILKNIFFEFDQSRLDTLSYRELNKLLAFLKKYPKTHIAIQGHTDDQGSHAYNQTLSARRAKSVVNYLTKKGINENRLLAVGFGESKPLESNSTKNGRAINRRVEFVVLQK